MRLFELLMLLVNVPLLIWPLFGRERPFWLYWLPITAVLLLLIHLWAEGYRWQMVPAYLLTSGLGVWAAWVLWQGTNGRLLPTWLTILLTVLGLLAFAIAIALPTLLPIPKLLPPTGPYTIGTSTFHLIDQNRLETYVETADIQRELMVQVWYPATPNEQAKLAAYMDSIDIAGPLIARDLEMPSFMFNHINLSKTAAYQQLPFAETTDTFPILVFSHGIRVGFRGQNTTQIQELTSHGYVVVSIDHTYGGLYSVFPNGRVAFFANDTVFPEEYGDLEDANRLMQVWAQDIGFVLDEMAQWHKGGGQGGSLFNGRLNLDRIGVFGHSTGGGATLTFCHQDGRCQAGVGLDSWVRPLSDELQVLNQPFMFMSTNAWLSEENAERGEGIFDQLTNDGYLLNIAGTEHFDFSDFPLFSPITPQLNLSGTIDSEYSIRLMSNYLLAFFDQYLKDVPSPLLNRSDAPFPEVSYRVKN